MEACDKVAYDVLKNNFNILCIVDMDVKRVSHEATQKGLISAEEKRAIWQIASREGISAGVAKMITCIMDKSRNGTFHLFLEVLDGHSDLKFWADCLRDEYISAKQANKDATQNMEDHSDQNRLKLKRSALKQEAALSVSENEEKIVFAKFKHSQGEPLGDIRTILASYRGDLRIICDSSQHNMLHVACETMNLDVVKLLVEGYKFDTNAQEARGNTPLHLACYAQKTEIVSYLLYFCNPNIRNSEGQTPLHIAGLKGPASLLIHLLANDHVDRTIVDNSGTTAVLIIASNPQLAWCLNKKLSTASLTISHIERDGQDEPRERLRRNTSAASNLYSYKNSAPSLPTAAVPPANGRKDSLGNYPIPTTNGDHGNGFTEDLKEDDHKEPEVVFRDKSNLRSQCIENEVVEEETCCLCCQPKFERLPRTRKQPNCTSDSIDRFCKMWIVVSIMLFGILVGLSLLVGLAYFLATDS